MVQIKILILEDNLQEAKILEGLLSTDFDIIGVAKNYEEAIELFNKHNPELAILDVYIDGEPKGISVADYINHRHPIPILFLTNANDRLTFQKAKEQKPYAFLLKPVNPDEIQFTIELTLEKYADEIGQLSTKESSALKINENLYIKKGNILTKVAVNEIYHIESDDKYCYIYTNDSRFLVQRSLKSFAETLPENFIEIHRKYIINKDTIKSIYPNDYIVTLQNEKNLPISQRKRESLLKLINIIK